MVFAADNISKVRELRLEQAKLHTGRPPSARRRECLRHYEKCLELIEDRLGDSPLGAQLALESAHLATVRDRQMPLAVTADGSIPRRSARPALGVSL